MIDVFKNQSLGIRHGEGFWAEVDESSMLLLRIVCKTGIKLDDESSPLIQLAPAAANQKGKTVTLPARMSEAV